MAPDFRLTVREAVESGGADDRRHLPARTEATVRRYTVDQSKPHGLFVVVRASSCEKHALEIQPPSLSS